MAKVNRGWIKKGWRNIPVFGKAVVLPPEDFCSVIRLQQWMETEKDTFEWSGDGGTFADMRSNDERRTRSDAERVVRAIEQSRDKFTRGNEYNFSKELWGMLVIIALKKTDIINLINDMAVIVEAAYNRKFRRGVVRTAKQQKRMIDIRKAVMLENIDINAEVKKIKGQYL